MGRGRTILKKRISGMSSVHLLEASKGFSYFDVSLGGAYGALTASQTMKADRLEIAVWPSRIVSP